MFPTQRPRRLRQSELFRRMVAETKISVDDLIMPLFVKDGSGLRNEIVSMPGNYQYSVDTLVPEVNEIADLGIPAIILFGVPEKKDPVGSEAYADEGVVQRALRAIKDAGIDIVLITDVCLCEYADHGHCGVVKKTESGFEIENDETLDLLARMAVSHAKAGADMVAPSDMMDGRIGAVRHALDSDGFANVPIMAYSAKYASSFYGPFRDAAESPPQFGDRKTYQMDSRNAREALREIELDIEEGADIVMVKPALAYLDIIARARERFDVPLAAYSVSGEFSMVKSAAQNGWLDEKAVALEMLTSIKRAGDDMILTYWA